MGYYSLVAPCYCCGNVFASNPHRVPSFQDQPICRNCIARINTERERNGLARWPVPADAYEPVEEGEL